MNYQCYELGNVRIKDGSALLDALLINFEGNATYTQNFQHEIIKPQNVLQPARRYISRNQETDD